MSRALHVRPVTLYEISLVNRDMYPGINLAGEVQGYKCRSIRRASPEFEEASTYYYTNNINLPVVLSRRSSSFTVLFYE